MSVRVHVSHHNRGLVACETSPALSSMGSLVPPQCFAMYLASATVVPVTFSQDVDASHAAELPMGRTEPSEEGRDVFDEA